MMKDVEGWQMMEHLAGRRKCLVIAKNLLSSDVRGARVCIIHTDWRWNGEAREDVPCPTPSTVNGLLSNNDV